MNSIFELIRRFGADEERGPTIADSRRELGMAALAASVDRRAARLREGGVGHGDRVLVACANSLDWVISVLAVMRLGAIVAPINPQATAAEVRVYESIVDPRGAIVDDPGAQAGKFRAILGVGEGLEADLGTTDLPPPPAASDRALILFTSGTTGVPKAAVQSHRMLILSGEGFAHWLGLSSRDRLLITMPLFHANGIYYSLMGGLCAGAGIVIEPRFSASGFWGAIARARATEVNLMGPMLSMLLKQPERPEERGHPLRIAYTAAAPPAVLTAFAARFGVEVVEGYGLTETSYGCINPRGSAKPGSVGVARQHPRAAIANDIDVTDASGRPLASGEVGEIVIKNAATTREYWNNPQATAAAFRDGWLLTGDLGYRDQDGYFFIVGRSKEMIRRKGVNIAPREIELILTSLPGIEEAALVGIPSPLGEELAIAVVTPAPGVSEDGLERRILARLAELLSREKLPDEVVVVAQLPKTATHRVEKAKLREWLLRRRVDQGDGDRPAS